MNGEHRRHTIVVLAENRDGILARVSALFAARGYVVDSIAIGAALDPSTIRMVVVVQGDDSVVEQVTKQVRKLIEVVKVTDLTDAPHIEREMLLVRVAARAEHRAELTRIADTFHAKIVDQTPDTYVLELSGDESKLGSFIDILRPFGIHEVVRTGKIAIARGVSLRQVMNADPMRRKHARHPVGLEVRVVSVERSARRSYDSHDTISRGSISSPSEHLLALPVDVRAHDISATGMSLKTRSAVAIGTILDLQIVHPQSGEPFPLRAVVRRHIDRPDFRGIGVEFIDVDETHRQRLDAFISGEAAEAADRP